MVLPSSFPAAWILGLRVRKGRRTQRGKSPPPDSDPFSDVEFGKNLQAWQDKWAARESPQGQPENGNIKCFAPAEPKSGSCGTEAAGFAGSLAKILPILQSRLPNSLTDLDLRAHSLDLPGLHFDGRSE